MIVLLLLKKVKHSFFGNVLLWWKNTNLAQTNSYNTVYLLTLFRVLFHAQ